MLTCTLYHSALHHTICWCPNKSVQSASWVSHEWWTHVLRKKTQVSRVSWSGIGMMYSQVFWGVGKLFEGTCEGGHRHIRPGPVLDLNHGQQEAMAGDGPSEHLKWCVHGHACHICTYDCWHKWMYKLASNLKHILCISYVYTYYMYMYICLLYTLQYILSELRCKASGERLSTLVQLKH